MDRLTQSLPSGGGGDSGSDAILSMNSAASRICFDATRMLNIV